MIDSSAVVDVLPRTSLLQRRDPSTGGSQPMAANVDVVGIVCGLDRPVNPGRIQPLLNALAGRELSAVGRVRTGDAKGRHTTTARQLHVLDGCCRLIDTPGVREVGLYTFATPSGRGLGTRLMLALIAISRAQGRTPLCSTEPDNPAARAAIGRTGFRSRHRVFRVAMPPPSP